MASFMADLGARLVDNGYAVIPIMPGTKKPGRFICGAWRDYPGWTKHCQRPTTENEISVWSQWPDVGIGIAGGIVAAVDIDVADADVALRIEALAREQLGDTQAVRIGRPPKRLLVYRTDAPFKGVKRAPIEVLCEGQQFVAFAVHPDTGRPYEWPEESLADIDIGQLPVITEAQARVFVEEAYVLLPESLRPARLGGGELVAHEPSAGDLRGTVEAVSAALAYIPNADLDYDSWVRIGMALKGALGDDGETLFAEWSAQSAKNVPETTAKTWASFRPRSIGAGTIYHHAITKGWSPDPTLVLNGNVRMNGQHPARGLLERLNQPSADGDSPPFAVELPPVPDLGRLDGALKMLVDYTLETAIRPQPWLTVGAALTALGTLMGRKYCTETNLRSNLYVVGLAASGGGKDHARNVIKETFVRAGLAGHLGGNRIVSGAGLLSALYRQPASLFQIDEFGQFLACIVDKRRAPKHLAEIWDLFTELATSAGNTFLGAEYADQKTRPRQDIIQPCCCVHATSVPDTFWSGLRTSSLQDGSIARFLIFQAVEDIPDRNRAAAPLSNIPEELLDALKAIAAGVGNPNSGNLTATEAPNVVPNPYRVPMTEDAKKMFDALDDEITLRQRKEKCNGAVLARVWENTAKVAMIKAVSANPVNPIIRLEDAEWGRDVVAHCVATLFAEAERYIAENDTERNHKRVLGIIRAAGPAGLTKNDLARRTQFLDQRQRADIIGSLVEAGQVITALRPSATKQAMIYRICDGERI